MKYMFETVKGKEFTMDCDPNERLSGIVQKAILERGCKGDGAELLLRGAALDPNDTLADYGVDSQKDVLVFRGAKKKGKKRTLTLAEEEEALEEAIAKRREVNSTVESLESLRDSIIKNREDLEKPTFLSKAAREKRALEKRQEEVRKQEEERRQLEESRKSLFSEAHEAGRQAEKLRREGKAKAALAAEKAKEEEDAERLKRQEQEQIKDKYLGKKKVKKVILKPSERMVGSKQFESWDAADDTSHEINPLYAQRQEIKPLFGRGLLAGIDINDQSTIEYEQLVEDRVTEKMMSQLKLQQQKTERRRAADAASDEE